MDVYTRYFSGGGPHYDALMTRENLARLQAALPFHADVSDLHDALTNAYNTMFAQGAFTGNTDRALQETTQLAADMLVEQQNAALAMADAQHALDLARTEGPTVIARPIPIPGKGRSHKREPPPPRTADTFNRDVRVATVPRSNRSLSAVELRQMRGVATQELFDTISYTL